MRHRRATWLTSERAWLSGDRGESNRTSRAAGQTTRRLEVTRARPLGYRRARSLEKVLVSRSENVDHHCQGKGSKGSLSPSGQSESVNYRSHGKWPLFPSGQSESVKYRVLQVKEHLLGKPLNRLIISKAQRITFVNFRRGVYFVSVIGGPWHAAAPFGGAFYSKAFEKTGNVLAACCVCRQVHKTKKNNRKHLRHRWRRKTCFGEKKKR